MLKKLINSILAGVSIALGGTIYLLCSNKIVGAFLFAIGILLVMEFKFLLYTGYVPTKREEQKFSDYLINSTFVFIGNLIGGGLTAGLLALTKLREPLYEATLNVCNAKLNDELLSVFILAIFCGIIIAGIVKATNMKKQILFVAMMIATFILCGFEHVVANSFYFAFSLKLFTFEGLLFMLVCLAGNFVGGLISSFVKSPAEASQKVINEPCGTKVEPVVSEENK